MIFRINRIIKNLVTSDVLMVGGFGLIMPIFALFIEGKIEGATIEVVGFSWTIFLISKSLTQLPIAGIIDKIKGEKDDFWFVFISSFLFSLIPLSYIFINTVSQLYLVQFIYGLFMGASLPAWNAIYIRHIDKNHEGLESSYYSISTSIASAIAASIGGIIAYRIGFNILFVFVSIISLFGTYYISKLYKDLYKLNFLEIISIRIKK